MSLARSLQSVLRRRTHNFTLLHSDRQLALDLCNASGPIGLGLFRVTIRRIAAVNFAEDQRGDEPDGDDERSA